MAKASKPIRKHNETKLYKRQKSDKYNIKTTQTTNLCDMINPYFASFSKI